MIKWMARFLFLVLIVGFYPSFAAAQEQETEESTTTELSSNSTIRVQQHLIRGLTRAFQNDHEEAIAEFEQGLNLAPEEPSILSALSSSYFATGDYSSALFFIREAVRVKPDHFDYASSLSVLLEATGDVDGASRVLSDFAAAHPQERNAQIEYVQLLHRVGRSEQLFDSLVSLVDQYGFQQRVPLNETVVPILDLMAETQQTAGKTEDWFEYLEKQAVGHPESRYLTLYSIDTFIENKKPQAAQKVIDAALKMAPKDADLLFAAETVALLNTESDNAILSLSGPETGSLAQLINAYLSDIRALPVVKNPDVLRNSSDGLYVSLRKTPEDLDLIRLAARAAFATGDFANAGELFSKATTLNPRLMPDWAFLIETYTLAGDTPRALSAAQTAMLLFPDQINILYAVAGAHGSGNSAEALELLENAQVLLNDLWPDDLDTKTALETRITAIRAGAQINGKS